jgi:hypothetical protein
VVRGDPERSRSFAVFYLRQGALIAVDAVNRAPEFMMSSSSSPIGRVSIRQNFATRPWQ